MFAVAIGALALGLILGAGVARAEPEPNDTMSSAVPVTVGTQGIRNAEINPANDEDYYKFSAQAGRTYVVEVFNVSSSIGYEGTELYVYDSAGSQVAKANYYCNGGGNVCNRATVDVPISGTYYFLIIADSGSVVGTYSTRVLPRYDQGLTQDASGEPNDVIALARQIGVGRQSAQSHTIYPRDPSFVTRYPDQDTFRFSAMAGRTYTVEVFNVSNSIGYEGTELYVYNSAGSQVAKGDYYCNGSGNVCNRVVFDVPIGGMYYFTVVPDSGSASGTYRVRVLPRYDQGLVWDTNAEPNDATALAYPLALGVAQAHTLYPTDSRFVTGDPDNDVFRITAQAGRRYIVEVKDRSAGLGYTNLYVDDSAGSEVARANYYCNGSGSVCNRVVFDVSISGNYFLWVNPDSGSGLYTICAYPSTMRGCSVNALRNPSFETDQNRDSRPDTWTSDQRFTRSSEIARHQGAYVGRFYATDNSNVTVAQTVGNFPAGKRYYLSSWVNIPASSDAFTFKVQVRWRDAANRVISTQTIRTYTAKTSGWNQAAAYVTAPAGTNNAQVVLATTSLKRKIYVDDFTLKAAP